VKLKDQVAIVTGAGRNIGEETSKLLAAEGAKVAIVDFDRGRGDKVAAEIRAEGGDALALVADVSIEADVIAMVERVVDAWGRIDILVNNAAITDHKSILEITKAEWDQILAVTLTGPFLVSKYVAQRMVDRAAGGKIVLIGSTSGFRGRLGGIAYASAKGGVVNLTRTMAVQLAPYDIRVNGIVPNQVGSPVGRDVFDPNRKVYNLRRRVGLPIDVARAVLFLVSDDSDFVVGDLLFVDGGMMVTMEGAWNPAGSPG
jgi:NAD(P)-dependent dehydrogenase (short-subunit alcohol dehydrogenase family)